MNKKLRCGIAAALALVLVMSAFIVFPTVKSGTEGKTAEASLSDEAVSRLLTQKQGLLASGDEAIPFEPVTEPDGADPTEGPTDGTEAAISTTAPTQAATEAVNDPITEPVTEEATGSEGTENDEDPSDPVVDATEASTDGATEAPVVDPDYVGEVTEINRAETVDGVIDLSWGKVDGAQGYHVYWRNEDVAGSAYTLLSSVKDTSLTIRNLSKGSMYRFRITAYRSREGQLIDGEGSELKAGTNPVGPSNFHLASGVSTGTLLRWNQSNLCDGYVLYRQFDGKWSLYKELSKDTYEFRDTDVIPGRAYNYRLCTYREDSRGRLESSPMTVRTICGLCAPADNGTTTLLRKMYFKWTKNPYAHGYEIRYSSDGKNFQLLQDTTATSYTSNRFIVGKHYYFRIYPYHYLDNKQTKIYGTYLAKDLVMTNSAYGKEVSTTYIEVSISQQHMWYYINGELYVSTDVVTGNYNSMDTPKGYWEVNNKCSPCTLVGDGYVSYVDYWMAFIGGAYGIHDASWRSEFGGTIYKGNGSHGCVNTPFAAVKKMYAKVTVGTPVIIY